MKNPIKIIEHLPKPPKSHWRVTPLNDKYASFEVYLVTPHKSYRRICSLGRYRDIPWMVEMMFIDLARRLLADAQPNKYSYDQDEIRAFWERYRKESF